MKQSETNATKQSTNETRESNLNPLTLDESKCNLLIHFWFIDFICFLDSRDLDCFVSPADFLAMTG